MQKIDFNSRIHILDIYAWMDGGSVSIKCKDKTGVRFNLELVQKMIWEIYPGDLFPGRIYLNEVLVEQRSELEAMILKSLENPIFLGGYECREIIKDFIKYVNSESYLSDIKKVVVKPNRKLK